MPDKRSLQPLTEKQEKFVDAFLSDEAGILFDAVNAYCEAGYSPNSNMHREAQKVLRSKAVVSEIMNRMADPKWSEFWIDERAIVKQLWKEATKTGIGASHAARINALVWIGKHLGMWQEKREERDTKPSIQVINYGLPLEKVEEELSNPEVEQTKDSVSLPEGVMITSYADEDNIH